MTIKTCESCGGSGVVGMVICFKCDGRGTIYVKPKEQESK